MHVDLLINLSNIYSTFEVSKNLGLKLAPLKSLGKPISVCIVRFTIEAFSFHYLLMRSFLIFQRF